MTSETDGTELKLEIYRYMISLFQTKFGSETIVK